MKSRAIYLAIAVFLTCFSMQVKAQKSSDFMDDVWYGANVGLGLGGNNYGSYFGFELSPMAGYKFTPRFSVGPRLIFDYAHIRERTYLGVEKFNLFSYGIGAHTRFKIIHAFFIQGELNVIREQILSKHLEEYSETNPHALLGIGFNQGGGEILLLYDFLFPGEDTSLPIELRVGFTVNF